MSAMNSSRNRPDGAELAEWLADHEAACRRITHRWIEDSWAVPVSVLRLLWPDPTWQLILRGVVIGTRDTGMHGDPVTVGGLLLDIGEERVQVLGLDGGARWIETEQPVFLHHDDIPDTGTARKIAAEHGLSAQTGQLSRKGYRWRPNEYDKVATFDWVRRRQLGKGLAPVGPRTAESLEVPGFPREQAVRVRVYRHPALGEREVICLLSDTDGAGADLRAARLGCAPPEIGPPVLAVRRSPLLGYPAWAIVHDPDATEAAWEGLRALNAARRIAVDHPKRALEALRRHVDEKLPASHAPAFWLEATSVFDPWEGFWTDQHECDKQCRSMAIEACRNTGMFGDLDLWYALALDDWKAKLEDCCDALAERDGPEAAYEAYQRASLHRGWHASTDKYLHKLAVAAGRDDVEHQARELADLIRHKGQAFSISDRILKSRRKAFVRLAQTDDHCLRLLFMFPYQLAVFHETGVFGAMLRDPLVVRRLLGGVLWPGSSASEWVNELYGEHLRSDWVSRQVLDLLAFLAPVLAEEGEGVRLADDDGLANLNSLDVACQHGIPLADPVRKVSLTTWYRLDGSGRRPLTHVAADPRFRELLKDEIAAFEGAPEPPGMPRNRPTPPPFERGQLLEIPALAPLVAEVCPELASSVGGPADSVLRKALAGFGLRSDKAPDDRISTVRSMRAVATRLRGAEPDFPDDVDSIGAEHPPAVHWVLLIEHLGAVAVRAASPATTDEKRDALVEFLRLWATMPFVAEAERGWQYGALSAVPGDLGEAVTLYRAGTDQDMWFVRPIPRPGEPDPLQSHVSVLHDLGPGWTDPERIEAFIQAVTERGPLRWDKPAKDEAAKLATALEEARSADGRSVTPAAGTLILAGFPGVARRNGLDSDQRKALKLKVGEDTEAYRTLKVLDGPQRLRLCAAVPPKDPATWWGKSGWDGATERVVAAGSSV
jgi:hypothetical protein